MRSVLALLFVVCVSAAPKIAVATESAPSPALGVCAIHTIYADKRPYESPNSNPFYAAVLEPDSGALFVRHEARLVVRTETQLFAKDSEKFVGSGAGFEFTLPTHERVISAWVDSVRAPDGSMAKCDPARAFFVNNYNDIQLTKQYKQRESYSRAIVDAATQVDVGFGIKIRKIGRRPDGIALPMPTPCEEDDRKAAIVSPLRVTSPESVTAGITPSVTVDVSPRGSVMDVDIKQSAGSRSLDDAMIAAARKTAFTPARWKCNAIPDRMIVSAVFVKTISDKP